MHEVAWFSRGEPDHLLALDTTKKREYLRHPKSTDAYFQSLFDCWPSWSDAIAEEAIYAGFFTNDRNDRASGFEYWQSIIGSVDRNIVIQECRSTGRMPMLYKAFPGMHIYLYRNPWDQWWSYKVDSYFDCALQLIMQAKSPPNIIKQLLSTIGVVEYSSANVEAAMAFYKDRPLSAENSYLCFYLIWCLSFDLSFENSDLRVSIDKVSTDISYREEIAGFINGECGIEIDLSDAAVPIRNYDAHDIDFFTELESKVHELLIAEGWDQSQLDRLPRRKIVPDVLPPCCSGERAGASNFKRTALELLDYNAAVSERWSEEVGRIKHLYEIQNGHLAASNEQTAVLRRKLAAVEHQMSDLQVSLAAQRVNYDQLCRRHTELEHSRKDFEATANALRSSMSWRITWPLRLIATLIYSAPSFSKRAIVVVFYWAKSAPSRALWSAIVYLRQSRAVKYLYSTRRGRRLITAISRAIRPQVAANQPAMGIPTAELTPRSRRVLADLNSVIDGGK